MWHDEMGGSVDAAKHFTTLDYSSSDITTALYGSTQDYKLLLIKFYYYLSADDSYTFRLEGSSSGNAPDDAADWYIDGQLAAFAELSTATLTDYTLELKRGLHSCIIRYHEGYGGTALCPKVSTDGGTTFSYIGDGNIWVPYEWLGTRAFGTILPWTHDLFDIGSATYSFDDIYATNTTIQTSDQRKKKEIQDEDCGLEFVKKLKPKKFKWLEGGVRPHHGLLAQDVETLLNEEKMDFAGFVKSTTTKPVYSTPPTDPEELKTWTPTQIGTSEETHYGLRMAEFIAPIIKSVQELSAKVEVLESKVP